MKIHPFLLLMSLVFIFQSCGNSLNNWRYVDRCLKCKKINSMTIEQRNEKFQFKNSAKIAYASFPKTIDMDIERYFENLEQNPGTFNINDFYEVKFLNSNQINQLSDLVYNIGFRKNINGGRSANCYFPHNAILFLNEENALLGYLEICFDCHKYRSSSDHYTLGEECSSKIKLLRSLFEEAGITYISSLKSLK